MQRKPFIEEVIIDHGPTELLGRLFLRVDSELRQRGITMRFASFHDLLEVNRAHQDSWHPMFSSFDPETCQLDDTNGYCLLGYDKDGQVATTQVGRLFDWSNTTMFDELASMRVLYDDPERDKREGERITVTAEKTKKISGRCAFLGAIWVRPDFRRKSLPALMGRLSRAYALTRWNVDYTTAIVTEPVHKGLMVKRLGTENTDWSVDLVGCPLGDMTGSVIWASADEITRMCQDFLTKFDQLMDHRLHYRRAHQ